MISVTVPEWTFEHGDAVNHADVRRELFAACQCGGCGPRVRSRAPDDEESRSWSEVRPMTNGESVIGMVRKKSNQSAADALATMPAGRGRSRNGDMTITIVRAAAVFAKVPRKGTSTAATTMVEDRGGDGQSIAIEKNTACHGAPISRCLFRV